MLFGDSFGAICRFLGPIISKKSFLWLERSLAMVQEQSAEARVTLRLTVLAQS